MYKIFEFYIALFSILIKNQSAYFLEIKFDD